MNIFSCRSKSKYPIIVDGYLSHVITDKGETLLDFTAANMTCLFGYRTNDYIKTLIPNLPGKSNLERSLNWKLQELLDNPHFLYFVNGSDSIRCVLRMLRARGRTKIGFVGYGGNCDEFSSTINQEGISIFTSGVKLNPDNTEFYDEVDIIVFESRYEENVVSNCVLKNSNPILVCDHLKSGIMGLWEKKYDFDIYGKNITNGVPFSILTANCSMDLPLLFNNVYFSSTWGGYNLGCGAVLETIKRFELIRDEFTKKLDYAKKILPEWGSLSQSQINWMVDHGVLTNGFWSIMTCHTINQINYLKELFTLMNAKGVR